LGPLLVNFDNQTVDYRILHFIRYMQSFDREEEKGAICAILHCRMQAACGAERAPKRGGHSHAR
jgi:hypothetical protein